MSTDIGGLGVWSYIDNLSAAEAAVFARRLESWGYSALWVPEAVGRDPFAILAWLAAHTSTLVFATGIANIYARDPMTMKGIRKTLAEMAPGRFVMGLGVSHSHLVNKVRGHDYSARPVATMRAYLEGMERALYMGPEPAAEAPIVLAALRQNMLQLAAEKTRGAHPYFVPPEHTARARELLGPEAWLCPEQMILLETDASKARAVARKHMAVYVGLPNYQNNLREYGFDDHDFADGGSDRLVDAIVAWGNETAIRARIEAHRSAGANHVCIQPFRPDGEMGADLRVLELLAPTAN
ncbi:MAG: TIGR03620 family F420-dependent LLM class oxidoreductase [Gammaproteobacteria bacterium]|nr:TIGR03620 family F420-dependent LLM class oxidoreductase [Gammaproteobacteria bacterium]